MPHAVSLDWEFPDGGKLDFVSAGRQNRDYSSPVTAIDWDNFYDRLGGGQFFDALREDMKQHYDYTLIDSRTGLSRHRRHLHRAPAGHPGGLLHAQRPVHRGRGRVARNVDQRYQLPQHPGPAGPDADRRGGEGQGGRGPGDGAGRSSSAFPQGHEREYEPTRLLGRGRDPLPAVLRLRGDARGLR